MIGFFDINRNQSITHNDKQIGKYHSIFINTMAAIARSFNAQIVKPSGSSIMIYFPRTSDPTNTPAFKDILECCLTMIAANHFTCYRIFNRLKPCFSDNVLGLPSLSSSISSSIKYTDTTFEILGLKFYTCFLWLL
jgi:hypothetical protein